MTATTAGLAWQGLPLSTAAATTTATTTTARTITGAPSRMTRPQAQLTERFRRAVCSDDLASAKRIADRALSADLDTQPFTIQNQTASGDDSMAHAWFAHAGTSTSATCGDASRANGAASSIGRAGAADGSSTLGASQVGSSCPALSASQYRYAQQCRSRDRNREAGRCKSSLVLAVEHGASIEMIQWLLDMGHEQGTFSTDARGCTIVSLAAQHGRTDVIEACCTDAVAHAASLHHERSLHYGYRHGRIDDDDDDDDENDGNTDNAREMRRDTDDPDGFKDDTDESSSNGHLSLQTAAMSTPHGSRRPSPALLQGPFACSNIDSRNSVQPGDVSGRSSAGGSSEMDDIVAVMTQSLLDAPDELGRTALSLASMKGFHDVVRILVEFGASIDMPDYEGNTPLHYAAAYNHLLVVQLLIERGCAHNAKNYFDFTAADYAYSTSLKSALEAFVRAQHDGKRTARSRIVANATMAPIVVERSASTSASLRVASPRTEDAPQAAKGEGVPGGMSPASDKRTGLLSANSIKALAQSRSISGQASPAPTSSSVTGSSSSVSSPHRSPDIAKRSPKGRQPSARHGGYAM